MGLMTIMGLAIASMMTTQHREMNALREALAAADFQKTLTAALANGSVCKYVLNNPSSITFDSTSLPQTLTPSLPLYANVMGSTLGPVIAQVGTQASIYSHKLKVSSITLVIKSGSSGTYAGDWLIAFDPSELVRPLRPITVSTILAVDDATPGAAKVTDCMTAPIPASATVYSCPVAGDFCYGRYRLWPGGCNGQLTFSPTCAHGTCGGSVSPCTAVGRLVPP